MTAEELIKHLNSRKGWHGNQYRTACGRWLEKNKPKSIPVLEEEKQEPKPCPGCGSENVVVDADSLTTSMAGIEYQAIWVECSDCEFCHDINICDYPNEKRPSQLCIKQWNEL